ncbi:MAG: thiol peroxidase [Phycisphaeraceae bacterium]
MPERKVTFKGNPVQITGKAVGVGDDAPDATLIANDLSEVKLSSYKGTTVILSVVPSLDTGICDIETKRFNSEAGQVPGVKIVTVSRDLPFAQKRWCGAAGVTHVVTLSDFRTGSIGELYGLTIGGGPLAGLLTRCVMVVGKDGKIKYQEVVPEITQEPNYDAALAAAKSA